MRLVGGRGVGGKESKKKVRARGIFSGMWRRANVHTMLTDGAEIAVRHYLKRVDKKKKGGIGEVCDGLKRK